MREIKFRVWDKVDKNWKDDDPYEAGMSYEYYAQQRQVFCSVLQDLVDNSDRYVIQQYTNQTCDGVDIYEGDIVEAYWPDIFVGDEVKGTVVWNEHFNELLYPGWVIDTGKGLAAFPPWVKVLGNIFEGIKNEQTI